MIANIIYMIGKRVIYHRARDIPLAVLSASLLIVFFTVFFTFFFTVLSIWEL